MGGNGKLRRWRISFHKPSWSSSSSSSLKPDNTEPPEEFLCPISRTLMFDPVVVSSGQTFERIAVQLCVQLNFKPRLPHGSIPDFSTRIPNLALRTAILNWCRISGNSEPRQPDYHSVESAVRSMMGSCSPLSSEGSRTRDLETDSLKAVPENPQVLLSHASSELNPRSNFYSSYSSSSEESVIANTSPPLPFATRPSCISSTPSTSSELISGESVNSLPLSSEEEYYVTKLKNLDVFEQEQAVMQLRKTTRMKEEFRVWLCTPPVMTAIKPLLISRYPAVQTNAVAALVNLSLEKVNKVKIVRSGVVPNLIEVLKSGFEESQEHAAGAIFSLALDDDNKMAIGVLGALPPLMHALRTGTERTRQDSAMALYHLTLVVSNRVKLIRLGAVPPLLGMLRSGILAGRVVLVVCNLAACPEGKSALLDGNAVECLVGMLRSGLELDPESTRENCVAALYSLSQGSMRFKALAREARAVEVLQAVAERGTERGREKAKRMLMMLKGRAESVGGEEVDWEQVLEGGVSLSQYRVGRNHIGPNSVEF